MPSPKLAHLQEVKNTLDNEIACLESAPASLNQRRQTAQKARNGGNTPTQSPNGFHPQKGNEGK